VKIKLDPRAEQLPTMILRCRSENHHWTRVAEAAGNVVKGVIHEIAVLRECGNCGALRHDLYALPTFELLKRHYTYPDGYRSTAAKGKLKRHEYMAAYLSRELKELLS
jgi:hypothetical protein